MKDYNYQVQAFDKSCKNCRHTVCHDATLACQIRLESLTGTKWPKMVDPDGICDSHGFSVNEIKRRSGPQS